MLEILQIYTTMAKSFLRFLAFNLLNFAMLSWAEDDSTKDEAAEYFFYRCSGCHTVGQGNLSGPDLISSIQWNDKDLAAAVKKMEKNVGPLADTSIDQIVRFLKDRDVASRIEKQRQRIEAKLRSELPPASYETGQKLFRGKKALASGGPACITCHQFGNEGGGLGPDLTLLKDAVTGVVLQSSIEKSNYKIMRAIYEKQKITGEEALHLSEYLSHPDKSESRFAPMLSHVVMGAAAGFIIFLVLLWMVNLGKKGRARDYLFQKNIKD